VVVYRPMSCPACAREGCDGSCASGQMSATNRLREAALKEAERRQRLAPGDTLPDYDDGDEPEFELEDEQSEA
jgi:hypothetical protein